MKTPKSQDHALARLSWAMATQPCGHRFTSPPPRPACPRLGIILSRETIVQSCYRRVGSRPSVRYAVGAARAGEANTTRPIKHHNLLTTTGLVQILASLHRHQMLLALDPITHIKILRYRRGSRTIGIKGGLALPFHRNSQT